MRIVRYSVLAVALLAPIGLLAQGGPPDGAAEGMGGHRRMPSVDDQVKDLTSKLNLTDAQQSQVRTILQDQRDQMKKVMEDSSGSRKDNWSKMRELHQQSSAKIRDVLTDEQKPKYDKLEDERRERMQHRRGGDQGAPPDQQ